jgi:hypothetical protein
VKQYCAPGIEREYFALVLPLLFCCCFTLLDSSLESFHDAPMLGERSSVERLAHACISVKTPESKSFCSYLHWSMSHAIFTSFDWEVREIPPHNMTFVGLGRGLNFKILWEHGPSGRDTPDPMLNFL